MSLKWVIEPGSNDTLTAPIRAMLLAQYGYNAPGGDTYGVIVSVIREDELGTLCLAKFPFTFVLASYTGLTGTLEQDIAAAVAARLVTLRNAEPLTSIIGRKYPT